jgi:DNA-binding transcriptional regulator GbsR (MarR family)
MKTKKARSAKTKPKETEPLKAKHLPTEIYQLEEAVGDFMQYWGFKKIHGRIWAHLYTSSKPLDTEELMKRLKVSKGLMSLAMRDLINYSVIEQSATGKHGTVFYNANEDLQKVIFNVLKSREAQILNTTKNILEKLAKTKEADLEKNQLDRQRINSVLNLTSSANELLGFFLHQQNNQGPDIFSGINSQIN